MAAGSLFSIVDSLVLPLEARDLAEWLLLTYVVTSASYFFCFVCIAQGILGVREYERNEGVNFKVRRCRSAEASSVAKL